MGLEDPKKTAAPFPAHEAPKSQPAGVLQQHLDEPKKAVTTPAFPAAQETPKFQAQPGVSEMLRQRLEESKKAATAAFPAAQETPKFQAQPGVSEMLRQRLENPKKAATAP